MDAKDQKPLTLGHLGTHAVHEWRWSGVEEIGSEKPRKPALPEGKPPAPPPQGEAPPLFAWGTALGQTFLQRTAMPQKTYLTVAVFE